MDPWIVLKKEVSRSRRPGFFLKKNPDFQIKISRSSEGAMSPDFDSFRNYGNAFYFLRNLTWIFPFLSFSNSNYLPAKIGLFFSVPDFDFAM